MINLDIDGPDDHLSNPLVLWHKYTIDLWFVTLVFKDNLAGHRSGAEAFMLQLVGARAV